MHFGTCILVHAFWYMPVPVPGWDVITLVKCLRAFAQKKVQYHNAVNDTQYLILFWEYTTETIKKARYHDAVYDTCYFILVWKIPHKWPKKARYHDVVYDTCYFICLMENPT